MNPISFMTANYVARQLDYNMTRGWGQGEQATNEYFSPLDSYRERFETILKDIRALGFEAIDLWLAHLNPAWATAEHLAIARDLLDSYQLKVLSLAGWFGSTPEEFSATCQLAVSLETEILGGSTSMLERDRSLVIKLLQEYGRKLGLENHPEKDPGEMLAKIGDDGEGTLGTTIDTGWYATQAYSPVQAIEQLREHLFLVHLKDIIAAGAHDTCRYGEGIVPVDECVQALKRQRYRGSISIEHEPERYDPTEDCRASLEMLRGWLEKEEGGRNECDR